LRLDILQPRLEEWLRKAQAKGRWGNNPVITAEGQIVEPRMLGEGLRPSAVTRDLKWGVEVPKVGSKDEDEAMEGKVICEQADPPRRVPAGQMLMTNRCLGTLSWKRIGVILSILINVSVRRSHWLPVDHCHVHGQVGGVVEEPRRRRAVPVHGQRQ
jgi:hypothetical protein